MDGIHLARTHWRNKDQLSGILGVWRRGVCFTRHAFIPWWCRLNAPLQPHVHFWLWCLVLSDFLLRKFLGSKNSVEVYCFNDETSVFVNIVAGDCTLVQSVVWKSLDMLCSDEVQMETKKCMPLMCITLPTRVTCWYLIRIWIGSGARPYLPCFLLLRSFAF